MATPMSNISDMSPSNASPGEASTNQNKSAGNSGEWDFIETLIRILDKITDANRPLKEAAALFAINSLVGHRAIIPSNVLSNFFADDTGYGIKLNEWFLIIGLTGESRKSTVANAVKKYLRAVLDNLGNKYSVPDIFTPEGLIDTLDHNGGFLPWTMDEFGIILEMIQKKDYMGELTGLLQKLSDGERIVWKARTRGTIDIPQPYVTAFLCANLYAVKRKLITEDMIHHGFLNRLLLIWDEGVKNFVPMSKRILSPKNIPDISAGPDPNTEKLLNWGKKILELVAGSIWLVPTRDVSDEAENIEITLHEIMKKSDEVERGVRERYALHLWKLAGLYRISRMTVEELEECRKSGKKIITIEKEDLHRAYKFLFEIVDNSFKRLLEEMKMAMISKPKLESIEDFVNIVKEIVLKYGKLENGVYVIDRTKLYSQWFNKTKLLGDNLDKILKDLEKQEICTCKILPTNAPGRPKQLCYFKFQ